MEFPKHYSLVKEHEKHFELHDSRDGKKFNVAKNQMHPANQIKVMKLQKFDEGGTTRGAASVMDEPGAEGPSGFDPAMQDPIPRAPPATPQIPEMGAATPSPPAAAAPPAATQPEALPQVGGQTIPGKTPDVMNQFQANQALEEKGLQAKGAALGAEGRANAKAYEDANAKIGKFLDASNKSIDALGAQNDTLSQEVANRNIDPKAYFHNMSTGQKIGNAIALIIGGIGAGLTGGPNMALETLNKAIERDVESQKINLGKKQSLLSLNMSRFHDMRAAQTATMMQMNALLQGQIAANSARYGGAAGQAGTQALIGEMKNKHLQDAIALKQQVFHLGLQQHLAGSDVSKDNPLDYVQYVVPADKQKEVSAELGKSMFAKEHHEVMMNLWDKAQKEQTAARTGFGLFDAPATRELHALIDPLIKDQEGRITPMEAEHVHGVLPSSGQTDARQKELRQGFETFLNGKRSAPLAKTYGIDTQKFEATKANSIQYPVERVFKTGPDKGKIGIFDENTKKFLGYKK